VGVKVRGSCPKCGHVVDTEAPRDRVTWRGPCPRKHAGKKCDGRIVARRVAGADEPTDSDVEQHADVPKEPRKSRVVKVSNGPVRTDDRGTTPPVRPATDPGSGASGGGNGRPDRDDAGKPAGDVKPPADAAPGRRPAAATHPESGPRGPYSHLFGW